MLPASPDFPKDELLIFIGHSDDASAEAKAIKSLQSEIEKDFRRLLKSSGGRSPFKRIRLWEWSRDASSLTGGQEAVVNPVLDEAEIALFVFKERAGKVTWDELEYARKRSKEKPLHILAFFPESSPKPGKRNRAQAARDWATLTEREEALTSDWNAGANSLSVTPCQTYSGIEDLRNIVLEKLRDAIAAILASTIHFQPSTLLPSGSVQLLNTTDALRRYQVALKTELGTISLLGTKTLDNIPVSLTDTFVSLRLSDSLRSDRQESSDVLRIRTPEEVMSLVFRKSRLLLVIGDPGSGKTTLLKYYALSCIEGNGYRALGFQEPVLVFFLPLRELVDTGLDYAPLSQNLSAWSAAHWQNIPEHLFSDWLHNRKTLLLLDGLDEISDPEQRIKACGWIDRIVSGFQNASLVVTSRATGYRKGDGIELASLHARADIMDFTPKQQVEFLKKWFKAAFLRELPPDAESTKEWEKTQIQQARIKAATIIRFLRKEESRSLQALARVPMLLQIMATLWKEREYLPGTRVELYDAALNYILDYRDRQKKIYPLLPAKDAREVLTPVSLWMQEVLKKAEAGRAEMQEKIQEELNSVNALQNPPDAEKFCRNLVDRAGLLAEYGDQEYRFRHKSFQEYMAGVQLREDRYKEGRIKTLVEYFSDDDWWQEPLRYFIAQVGAETFDSFMQELFNAPVSKEFSQKQQDLLITLVREAPKQKTDALEKKLLDPATTPNRQRYIIECLKTIGKPEAIDVVRKFIEAPFQKEVEIMRRAAELTGSRELPCSSAVLTDIQGAQYILIKGGTFTYSLTKKPETVDDLYVAKYTVTNKLYRQFLGYLNDKEQVFADILPVESYKQHLLTLAGSVSGFSVYLQEEKDLAKRFRSWSDNEKQFNQDDQPVMGVTWYAAKAYCLWLSLLENNGSDLYRLPGEMEWEYAAAGKEGRTYPWGNADPTSKLANYAQNEGATTPVGRYSGGATPDGLYDMAGNVWEWMEGLYSKDTPARSMRGGSWVSFSDYLRCSFRTYYYPELSRNYDVGFRVVRPSHSLSF